MAEAPPSDLPAQSPQLFILFLMHRGVVGASVAVGLGDRIHRWLAL